MRMRLVGRAARPHDLGEAHHGRGRRPVPADDAVGTVGGGGDRGDREPRRVRREDRRRWRDLVELAEHADLEVEPLRDGLDDDVRRRGVRERRRELEARQRGVGVGPGDLAPLHRALEAVAAGRDVLAGALERRRVEVDAHGRVPRGRRHLRDPAAHHARADHTDPEITHRHPSSPFVTGTGGAGRAPSRGRTTGGTR